jgi:hypothetical protein
MTPSQLVDMRRRIREVIMDKLLRGMTVEELKIVFADVSKILNGSKPDEIEPDSMLRNPIDLEIDLTDLSL